MRFGDASPRPTGDGRTLLCRGMTSKGGSASRGSAARENRSRGRSYSVGRKRGEPHGRQHAANACAVTKEETVEVLGKHEGGTRVSVGMLTPKEKRATSVESELREWTSWRVDGGGEIFGQSQERKPVALSRKAVSPERGMSDLR